MKPTLEIPTSEPAPGEATVPPPTLDGLFPPPVRGALARVDDDCASPFPEEAEAVAAAVPSRRREFLCGRGCAHAALRALGRDGAPIAVGEAREPLWPAGVVGSISHAGTLAGAVVARASDAWGLGLDIELLEPPLDRKLERLLLTPDELAQVRAVDAVEPHAAKILFSAKECVYKCVFPRTRWRLDYQEVEITLDLERRRYRAVIEERFDRGELPAARLEGAFRPAEGYVITALHA